MGYYKVTEKIQKVLGLEKLEDSNFVLLGPSRSQKNKTVVLDQSLTLKSPSTPTTHHPPKTFKEVPGKLES